MLNDAGQVLGLVVRYASLKEATPIGAFRHLVYLDLSENTLTDVTPLAGLTQVTWLDVSGNKLTDMTPLVGLTQVTTLNLSRNRLTDVTPLAGLTQVTTLNLSSNQLTDVTPLAGLTQVTTLDVSHNQLTDVTPLAALAHLTTLNLWINQLTDMTPLAGLTQVTTLNLSRNRLTDVTPLAGMTQLTWLDVSCNQLTDVTPLAGLTQMTTLVLSDNQLTDVTPLAGLTQMTTLVLSDNQLTDVTPLAGLTQMTSLYLGSNQLTDVTPLAGLTKVTTLNLSRNCLTDVTPLAGLMQLAKLILENNCLTDVMPLAGLTQVKKLELSNNQITFLPKAFLERNIEIDWECGNFSKGINLFDNPLTTPPPEIVKQGKEAIRDYFRQQREAGQDYLYEAKLLIVGEAGAGKTTFAQKMLNAAYQLQPEEISTKGIDVLQWGFPIETGQNGVSTKGFRVNIWDFGGQEIYKATHQFFLTKRSLYVLVADSRKEDTDFYYWLNIVALLSDNSPVIILKNEKQDRVRELPERQLRGEFTNLKEILPANIATNRGLSTVMDTARHYLAHLPHVGAVLPKTWVNVRNALEQDDRSYIPVEEYYRICERHNFTRRADQLQLSGYLHDLGVCLHFQDARLLKKSVILKPEWGTAAVYKVLDSPTVIRNLGCFSDDDLKQIWHEAEYADMRDELLQLMMKFQLCYEIPGCAGHYIAPQLLSENAPDYAWETHPQPLPRGEHTHPQPLPRGENLRVRYAYEFMPKGMLTRFIVAAHPFIEDQRLVWKSGVVLRKDGARAEIIEYYGKREIHIRASGAQKKDLLTVVMYEFEKIHAAYSRLKYDTLIPCNCAACQASAEPHFYEFDVLKEFFANRQNDIQCRKKPYYMVNVRGLFDDVFVTPPESPEQAEERINELKRRSQDAVPDSEEDRRIRREFEQLGGRAR